MRTKKFHLSILMGCLSSSLLLAQNVGINPTGNLPKPSAGLDVDFTNKGLLIPRVCLSGSNDNSTINNPEHSLLVYNTGTCGLTPAGYYYNAGTTSSPNWVQLLSSTSGIAGSGVATRVAFWTGATTLGSDANLYWDNTNKRLGIGTAAPAQRLDVSGNVQFSGALMPGGNAGTSGQVLRSQGAGMTPVWFPMAASIVYQNAFNSTGSVCINNASWVTHPGCSTTISLQAGDIVWAWGYGAAMADNNCDGTSDLVYCHYDVRIAANGNDFPDGAWARGTVDNQGAYVVFDAYCIAGRFIAPTTANYTFELQTRRAGGSGNAITAGNNTSALQSGMMIIVYRP